MKFRVTSLFRRALLLFALAIITGCNAQGGRLSIDDTNTPTQSRNSTKVEIGEDLITLRSSAGRLMIRRAPLGFVVQTAAGDTVLQSTQQSALPFTLRAALPRAPGGIDNPDLPPLYAPITFLVGTATQLQFPISFWTGNMLAAAEMGVEYRLEDVMSVETIDNGVRLMVSSSDPSGRSAAVTVTGHTAGTFRVSVRLAPAGHEVVLTSASFASTPEERFHGFGGRRNALDQRGQDFINWAEGFSQTPEQAAGPALPPLFEPNFQFPTGPQGAYYVQSQFISSNNYGLWLEQASLSHWRMASDRPDAWMVEVAGGAIGLVVAPGEAPKAISSITELTGRHRLPPRWALGPMLSETIQINSETPQSYLAKINESLDKIEQLNLPITAFSIEGWIGLQERNELQNTIARLKARNIRPLGYFKGFVDNADAEYEDHQAFEEAVQNGFVAMNLFGSPFIIGSTLNAQNQAALIDFTNPAAVDWWQSRIREALDLGFEGWMQDFGEQIFVDMVFADGRTGIEMHNASAVLYHKATRDLLDQYVALNPEREPWFFVRFGSSGSARHESATWTGDNTADWSRASGLGAVAPDMLNRSIGGAYGVVSEIGGYIDTLGRISKELLIRWSHHASLTPVHRLHGGPVNGTHMPWRYDDEAVSEYLRSVQRHVAAQPLIMELWAEGVATGMPIMRPLWLMFPDDPEAVIQEQQWMLGPSVLVAPVYEPGVIEHRVYFPDGCWRHPETDTVHQGPGYKDVAAPLGFLPYYFRCGTRPFTVPAELRSE